MTNPLQPTTSLPKGSHNQNIIVIKLTLHYYCNQTPLSSSTELLVACMSSRSLRNAGISTESTAALTAEVTTESKVLCFSLNASLIPLAIASSISSLEMVESLNFFLYWRLPNLSFPIAFDCWSTHDESDAKWFEIYWQDNKIFDKVSRAKVYACIEVEGSRDLSRKLKCFLTLDACKPVLGDS